MAHEHLTILLERREHRDALDLDGAEVEEAEQRERQHDEEEDGEPPHSSPPFPADLGPSEAGNVGAQLHTAFSLPHLAPSCDVSPAEASLSRLGSVESLARTLAHASGWILLGLIVAVVLQAVFLIRLSRALEAHNRRWRTITRDASGLDLPTILSEGARERAEILALHETAQGRLARMEREIAGRKGRVGLVRYDAFADVGGESSFSLAVLDDAGDGVIVTSIVGREEGRVYCKGIIEGRPDRALSDEERRAIAAARDARASVAG
ncbi:DUF4446 family protein [bacterium]|nr:MAG: DUF4446 family protein [bacterium]